MFLYGLSSLMFWMLLVMAVVSVIVYERVGIRILRRGWFNLDLGWSFVLIGSGAITLFTA